MKILCLSDIHEEYNFLLPQESEYDIVIIAGDTFINNDKQSIINFNKWVTSNFNKPVILIAGNHDELFVDQNNIPDIKNLHYLFNSSIKIENYTIYGSPYTPRFGFFPFMEDKYTIKKIWQNIDKDTNILVTHGPPFNILDKTSGGVSAGCSELLNQIKQLEHLKLHIFGHIHEGYGETTVDNIKFVNASICDKRYYPNNKPRIIEI